MKSPYEGDLAYPAVLCYHDKQKHEIALHTYSSQVATALIHDATAFVTNDQSLVRVAPTLDIIILDNLLH